MKEEWLDKLHDKMENYEIDAPADLWGILQNAPCLEEKPDTEPKRGAIPLAVRISVAAAVAVLVLTFCYYIISGNMTFDDQSLISGNSYRKYNDDSAEKIENTLAYVEPSAEDKVVLIDDKFKDSNMTVSGVILGENINAVDSSTKGGVNMVESYENLPEGGVSVNEEPLVEEKTTLTLFPRVEGETHDMRDHLAYSRNIKSQGKITLSAYAGGGFNSSFNHISMGNAGVTAAGAEDAGWNDNPMLGILLYDQGKRINTHVRHRQPVRVGFSLGYALNQQLTLVTGLTYTDLMSDMKEGSDDNYITGEQNLHYLGIPVALQYDFLSWKKLGLYMTAGVLFEKNVSGKVKRSYILDNIVERTESDKIADKPVQVSFNLSPGIQLGITRSVGVFIEPGVSYYINNGSPVQNIYKDKPFNFNLNLGLRLNL